MSGETVAERLERQRISFETNFSYLAEQYQNTGIFYERLASFAASYAVVKKYSLGMTIALTENTATEEEIVSLFTRRAQNFQCLFVSMLKYLGCFELEDDLFETLVTIFSRYDTTLELNFAVMCAASERSTDSEILVMLKMLSSHQVTLAIMKDVSAEKSDVPEIRKRKK